MFSNIKTSRINKDVISKLTQKLNLGSENIIARIALSYSISANQRLELKDIKDSNGKEYSFKVLFGDYGEYYISMICVHYSLYKTDKDVAKYIKMHIDE